MKHYSSGMFVRLGFSVAVHVNPGILIVDEVIAVGDEEFQRRCFDHVYKLRREGVTIVMVTHSLNLVRTMCDHAAWFDHGHLMVTGTGNEVVQAYVNQVDDAEALRLEEADERPSSPPSPSGPSARRPSSAQTGWSSSRGCASSMPTASPPICRASASRSPSGWATTATGPSSDRCSRSPS